MALANEIGNLGPDASIAANPCKKNKNEAPDVPHLGAQQTRR